MKLKPQRTVRILFHIMYYASIVSGGQILPATQATTTVSEKNINWFMKWKNREKKGKPKRNPYIAPFFSPSGHRFQSTRSPMVLLYRLYAPTLHSPNLHLTLPLPPLLFFHPFFLICHQLSKPSMYLLSFSPRYWLVKASNSNQSTIMTIL